MPETIKLKATETNLDGVTSLSTLEAETIIRSGRVRLLNAFGSELLDLSMMMRSEYWQDENSGWQLNSDDTCTNSNLSFIPVDNTPDITNATCVLDTANSLGNSNQGCGESVTAIKQFKEGNVFGFSGDFNLWLKAPGVGFNGSIDVKAIVPTWLHYNWTTSCYSCN
jgi:MSHA biogenesis protein MshQ